MPSPRKIAAGVFAAISLFWVGYGLFYLAQARTDAFIAIGVILVLLWIYLIYRSDFG